MLHGVFIIRVHLDREVIYGVNKLHQQRELVSEGFIYLLSHQFVHIDLQQILQGIAGMRAIGYFSRIFLYI